MITRSTLRWPLRRQPITLVHLGLIFLLALGMLGRPDSAAALATTAVPRTDAWVPNGQVEAVIQVGNTIYLGGDFTYIGPPTGSFALLDPGTGAPNLNLPQVNGSVSAVAADGAGGWYIGGSFTAVGAVTRNNLAHIRANSLLDPSWDPNVSGSSFPGVYALAVSGNTVYVGGSFTTIGGQARNNIAALDANTGTATAWNPNASGSNNFFAPGTFVNALAVSGNTVYVGGDFTNIGGQTRISVAALDTTLNTNNATTWNPNANGGFFGGTFVYALAVSGNTVYVGGTFTIIGGQARNYIAALDASTGTATAWNPNASGSNGFVSVDTLAVSGNTVYVGGDFTSIGGQARNYVAALDASTGQASAWDPNASGSSGFVSVDTLAVSGNTVYVGGYFTNIGGQNRSNIAALDASTGQANAWDPNAGEEVLALAVSGTTIAVGGYFSSIGGQTRNYIAALDASTGQASAWDPNADSSVSALAVSGNTIYVGGDFTSIGGQTRNAIAALDATLDTNNATTWDPNADSWVSALAVSGTTVYAGGDFTSIGGQTRNYVAALDTTLDTNNATTWDPNADSWVSTLAVSGTTVYAGGDFTSIGGQTRNAIAALDATLDTNNATAWNPDASSAGVPSVNALAVSGNTVYVGGDFSSIGGQTRNAIAALDATLDTNNATTWNPNADDVVLALAASGATVVIGGRFDSIGGQAQPNLAIFQDFQDPTASASAATNVTATSATVNGSVNAQGAGTIVHFQYTTTSGNYTNATSAIAAQSPVSGMAAAPLSAQVTGLNPATTYFYRVVAGRGAISIISAEQSFTTMSAAPPIITTFLPLIQRP